MQIKIVSMLIHTHKKNIQAYNKTVEKYKKISCMYNYVLNCTINNSQ